MANSLLSTETCAVTSGKGMKTTWTLAGTTNAYDGSLTTTDGYSITASMIWILLTTTDTTVTGKNCTDNTCAIGTCVETYDRSGSVIEATVNDEGNMAICHWMYILKSATVNSVGVATSSTSAYSETRYLVATEWGTAGNALVGSSLMNTGTLIGATYGFARTPSTKPTLYTAGTYTQFWYQPTYVSDYSATSLRRYNGGASDGDKVKAYCAMVRPTDSTSNTYTSATALVGATVQGTNGVVTLDSAQALITGAIALGVAALAF